MDLKLHSLGDESFLIYRKISSLISLFSLYFLSLVFFPSLTRKENKGLNWSCSVVSRDVQRLLLPSLVSQ